MSAILAVACMAIWAYLLAARGSFWRGLVADEFVASRPQQWPAVTIIIPARNEAEVIGASVKSLLQQNYPGALSLVLVDDDSSDGTANVARTAAARSGHELTVVSSGGPPAGWSGKVWALKRGIAFAETMQPHYLLLTDADIVHAPGTLSWLVAQSLNGGFVLTSLMAELRCESLAERVHVPAFIYFFQMLFPFAWVNRTDRRIAAAAGGCMLIRAEALARAGDIDSIRNALIDDCALAARLKAVGPIWLSLTKRVRSIRAYPRFADVRQMIARSAYAQLRYSPLLLAATALGMALTFLAPPLLTLFAAGWPRFAAIATWVAMALSFVPTTKFHRLSPLWGLGLPIIAVLYLAYTFSSAYRHLRRRGGQWKGRVHVNAPSMQ